MRFGYLNRFLLREETIAMKRLQLLRLITAAKCSRYRKECPCITP